MRIHVQQSNTKQYSERVGESYCMIAQPCWVDYPRGSGKLFTNINLKLNKVYTKNWTDHISTQLTYHMRVKRKYSKQHFRNIVYNIALRRIKGKIQNISLWLAVFGWSSTCTHHKLCCAQWDGMEWFDWPHKSCFTIFKTIFKMT